MDLLLQCARNYEKLLDTAYRFTIARKGVVREFTLSFQKSDFHHMAGLHKLTDKMSLQHGSREALFDKILSSAFNLAFLQSSFHFAEMRDRLTALTQLEKFLDSENLIFKYNENVRLSSSIKSEYLLEGLADGATVYLFLGSRDGSDMSNQMCRTFFPKTTIDYSYGQPRYTLLKKEKVCVSSGAVLLRYAR